MKKTVAKFTVSQPRNTLLPDSVEHTLQLFELGHYPEALQGCLAFVSSGDVRILLALKEIYQFGLAGQLDLDMAENYLSMAARQDPESCFQLAQWLEKGFNDDPDPVTAVQYYMQAADMNHPKALLYLADCYSNGRLLMKDPEKAFDCILRAQMNAPGDKDAEYRLAMCFLNGDGTPANPTEALHYLSMAVRHKSVEAIYELALMYSHGRGVTADRRKGFRLMNEAAAMNYAPALFQLGLMYEEARGTTRNPERAFSWYHMAYELNYVPAFAKMAAFLIDGESAGQDYRKARSIAQRGAELGNPECSYELFRIYMKGLGVKADRETAMDHLNAAASGGSVAAMKTLGDIFLEDPAPDPAKAAEWYAKAADQGNEDALLALADIYSTDQWGMRDPARAKGYLGTLTEKFSSRRGYYRLGQLEESGALGTPDPERVRFCYTEAARRGFNKAKFSLARLYHQGTLLEKDDRIAYYHAYGISSDFRDPEYAPLLKDIECALTETEKNEIRQNVRMETMSLASHKMQY